MKTSAILILSWLLAECTVIGFAVGSSMDGTNEVTKSIPIDKAQKGELVYVTLNNFERVVGIVTANDRDAQIIHLKSKDGSETYSIPLGDIENISVHYRRNGGKAAGLAIGSVIDATIITTTVIYVYLLLSIFTGRT